MLVSTKTVRRRSWRIQDVVVRLRERGTDRVYGLPVPPIACWMGTSGRVELQLHDPSATVSREHAELVPVDINGGEVVWKVYDRESKNGLCCDGEQLRAFVLRPGLEVRLGSLRLLAESKELVELLSFTRRCLGWAADRQEDVDQAMQNLRDWAAQRTELILVGDGNLRSVLRRWHDFVIGADVPFTWCEPGTGTDAAAVVKEAATGTLCIDTTERQAEALAVVEHVHAMEHVARPQLVVCTPDPTSPVASLKAKLERPTVIQVPPLAMRSSELMDILQEYAWEIARAHGLSEPRVEAQDLEQLGRWPYRSLAEVADDVLRLVMLRTWGVRAGAARLGVSHGSLSPWAHNRGLKT